MELKTFNEISEEFTIRMKDKHGNDLPGVYCDFEKAAEKYKDQFVVKQPEGQQATEWDYTDPPKDGTKIVRWHRIWKCIVTVRWDVFPAEIENTTPWIDGTCTATWPEEAFLPGWMPLIDGPAGFEHARVIDLPIMEIDE